MTPAPSPRVTVVVTCFNQEQWIEQALDSVADQTEQDLQLIVLDDGSTDDSRRRITRWLASHDVSGEFITSAFNVGLPAMLNRGMPRARGRYVVVLNGDDWMTPTRVALQAAALDHCAESVGLVYSDLRLVDVDGEPTGEIFPLPSVNRPEGQVLARMISDPMLGMPMAMFRRSILDVVGPWDEKLAADDYDFFLRVAAANFTFTYLPGTLTNYRWHGTSMTATRAGALTEGRILALYKLLGRSTDIDCAIYTRVRDLAVALHSLGYERRATRRYLQFALRRHPSKRVARALLENYLHIPPGTLTMQRLRRAVHISGAAPA